MEITDSQVRGLRRIVLTRLFPRFAIKRMSRLDFSKLAIQMAECHLDSSSSLVVQALGYAIVVLLAGLEPVQQKEITATCSAEKTLRQ
ncbi:MAG: hypothetical protein LBT97_13725 [Planctomycetota bacterium]|jgi:hypothetical protein|nr:hypothetical protein [Planctomycetota bacterium]